MVGGGGHARDLAERDAESVGAAAVLRPHERAQLALADRPLAREADRAHLGERVHCHLRAGRDRREQQRERMSEPSTHDGPG